MMIKDEPVLLTGLSLFQFLSAPLSMANLHASMSPLSAASYNTYNENKVDMKNMNVRNDYDWLAW